MNGLHFTLHTVDAILMCSGMFSSRRTWPAAAEAQQFQGGWEGIEVKECRCRSVLREFVWARRRGPGGITVEAL